MSQKMHQTLSPQIAIHLCRLQPRAAGEAIGGHKNTTTNAVMAETVPTNITAHSTIVNAKRWSGGKKYTAGIVASRATKQASGSQGKKRENVPPSGVAIPGALPMQFDKVSDATTSTFEISGRQSIHESETDATLKDEVWTFCLHLSNGPPKWNRRFAVPNRASWRNTTMWRPNWHSTEGS